MKQISYVSQALYETLQTTRNHKNDDSSKMSWLPSPPRITGGGGGHPDPKIGVGGVVFFRSFRPQFGPTIRGAWGAPGSVTDN